MLKRTTIREYAVQRLRQEFGDGVDVTDNALLSLDTDIPHLVVMVANDDLEDEQLDGAGLVSVTLAVRSSSSSTTAQSDLDERFDQVGETLLNEDFLEACGGVSAVYAGYEFNADADEGYATGEATYIVQAYETASA